MILIFAATVWLAALVTVARTRKDAVRDLLAMGLLGAATALFFWRLLAGQVWMPAGGGDLAQFLYPTYTFAAEWWRQGIVPLWNPYLFAGAPFVGDIQSGIFYPLNLLTFFLAAPLTFRDMEFLSVLHFWIAGAGMYALLRFAGLGAGRAPLSRTAALAGAIAFEFSDLFITHFGNLNLIAAAAWMPCVLLLYRRAVLDMRLAWAVLAGVFLAAAFLAGHIQSFLFIVLVLVLWAGLETLLHVRAVPPALGEMPEHKGFFSAPPFSPRSRTYPLFLLTITALVAVGLSAPALVPGIEMMGETVRATFSYEQAAQFSLPPAQLIGLVVPGFFGREPTGTWAPWPRVEAGYSGILPLLLAGLAFVLRRDKLTGFLGLLAVLGLGLALGGHGILHGWLYQLAPVFGQLRAPARFIFVLDFGIAALTAFGFDALLGAIPPASEAAFKRILRGLPWAYLLVALAGGSTAYAILILGQSQDPVLFQRMVTATNGVAFALVLLALAVALIIARGTHFFEARVWAVLALGLIFFDLFSLGAYVDISTDDPTRVFEHPDAVAFFKSNGGLYRLDSRGTGVDQAWPSDTSILYGLSDINGDNPLVLAGFDAYWQALGSRSTALYDLLNVKYLVGRKSVPLDPKFHLVYSDDPAVNIFENTAVLPRAFVVSQSRVAADSPSAFAAIHSADFNPARTVVLEGQGARELSQEIASGDAPVATVKGYGPNEILLETHTGQPGWLVLSEIYYPGWRAWVDDREVNVLRADAILRALELPAGSHQVRLIYDPLSFRLGQSLFFITLLSLLGWRLWGRNTWRK